MVKPALKPKQTILDWFGGYEKWVFREFYAATGVLHETIMKEYCRLIIESRRVWALPASDDRRRAIREREVEKSKEAVKRFDNEIFPAHNAKWGEWYFFHTQEAFKSLHEADSNLGPQTPTTPTDPEHDDLAYRPNA